MLKAMTDPVVYIARLGLFEAHVHGLLGHIAQRSNNTLWAYIDYSHVDGRGFYIHADPSNVEDPTQHSGVRAFYVDRDTIDILAPCTYRLKPGGESFSSVARIELTKLTDRKINYYIKVNNLLSVEGTFTRGSQLKLSPELLRNPIAFTIESMTDGGV